MAVDHDVAIVRVTANDRLAVDLDRRTCAERRGDVLQCSEGSLVVEADVHRDARELVLANRHEHAELHVTHARRLIVAERQLERDVALDDHIGNGRGVVIMMVHVQRGDDHNKDHDKKADDH